MDVNVLEEDLTTMIQQWHVAAFLSRASALGRTSLPEFNRNVAMLRTPSTSQSFRRLIFEADINMGALRHNRVCIGHAGAALRFTYEPAVAGRANTSML